MIPLPQLTFFKLVKCGMLQFLGGANRHSSNDQISWYESNHANIRDMPEVADFQGPSEKTGRSYLESLYYLPIRTLCSRTIQLMNSQLHIPLALMSLSPCMTCIVPLHPLLAALK